MPPLFPLYVICDAAACQRAGWSLVDFAAACLEGGARLLQLRAKEMDSARLLTAATEIVRRAARVGGRVVVNDRADLARLAGAAGVHVGQEDLGPAAVRGLLGPGALVGVSTHTERQQQAAIREPVDYLAVGPVFATVTKPTGDAAVGLPGVRAAAARLAPTGLPLVAIGGITLDQAAAVVAAGAQSVAVISDLLATRDPASRVAEYLHVLGRPTAAD